MDEELKNKLDQCKTLEEMFQALSDYYKLDECKIGVMSRPMIMMGFKSAITILRPVKR